MNVEVHIVSFCEERIIPFTLRHYAQFADKIVLHDSFSTDNTRMIARKYGAEVRDFDTKGQINDTLLTALKQEAWKRTSADWVIFVDADELVYFPIGSDNSFPAYEAGNIAVVKPYGYEMVSDVFPTTSGQIYDEVKFGGVDNRWYAKPCIWNPRLVKTLVFSAGAHECNAMLKDGRRLPNPTIPSNPPAYLLHFKHVDSVEIIAAGYEAAKARMSAVNKQNGWGWHGDPLQHAKNKREAITKTLQRVIA